MILAILVHSRRRAAKRRLFDCKPLCVLRSVAHGSTCSSVSFLSFSSSTSFSKTRTLSVLVENSPGVLARVSSLFSRRGYNIDSLAVGPTENPNFSRMTIVINVEDHALEQVVAQLDKLINVISITELDPVVSVQRELLLVKVSTD